MAKTYYSYLLTMTLIHGLLFFGTWQVIKNQEVHKLVPTFNAVIQMKLAPTEETTGVVAPPKVERPGKNIPTPEVMPELTQNMTAVGSPSSINPNLKFSVMDAYKAELRATIDKNKYYPTMSRRLGQTGTVVIAFTLLEDGNIVDIRIEKPSLYERLNVSALDAVKKVERFKPIPKEVGEIRMDIKVPVNFVTI